MLKKCITTLMLFNVSLLAEVSFPCSRQFSEYNGKEVSASREVKCVLFLYKTVLQPGSGPCRYVVSLDIKNGNRLLGITM